MRAAAAAFLAAWAVGCSQDEPGNDKDDPATEASDTATDDDTDPTVDTDEPERFADLDCALAELTPQVLRCTWTSPDAVRGYVVTELDGVETATPHGPSSTDHTIAALGLKMGQTYTYRAVEETDGGETWESEEGSVTIDEPSWAPQIEVTGTPTHPYVLVIIVSGSNSVPMVIDAEGDVVWHHEPETGGLITTALPGLDGQSVLFLRADLYQAQDVGTVFRVSVDGSAMTTTRALLGHHAFLEHAGGDLSWISYEYRTFAPDEWVSDVIRRSPEGVQIEEDHEVVFSWFDDYGHDPWISDVLQDNFALGDADWEWTHTNSYMQVDGDDAYYILSKFLDCVLKIDADGELVWQLGGEHSDFTNPDGSPVWRDVYDVDLFSHAHMSHLWDGGMVVFDNGYMSSNNGLSRAVEYAWNDKTMVVEEVWSYPDPDGRFTKLMGDVRKLDNGNYLVGWSSLKYLTEVSPKGEVVWQADIGAGGQSARLMPLDDLYTLR